MKKLLLVAFGLSLALSACMPGFLGQTSEPTLLPNAAAPAATATASPLPEILPTATQAPPSATASVAPTSTNSPLPPTETATTLPSLTNTPAAAVTNTSTPTLTFTPVTFTATLGFQSFGTLPPLVPSGKLLLMNKSHAEAYSSIQCVNKEGSVSIIEFPVGKWTETKAPAGRCDYVAWVGGRQFTGSFTLDTGGQRTITLYKNRIKIK
jgi:hypothetical protein